MSASRQAPVRTVLVGVLATFVLLGASAVATSAAPADGSWFGAHVNPRGGLDQYQSIVAFESDLGRQLAVVNRFHPWHHRSFRMEARHIADGRIPMISWRGTDDDPDGERAAKIARGEYDSHIAAAADAVEALGGRVLIRWNWEMDQPPGARQYIGEPSEFVAAWRRIHGIFRARGATNAQFVWAPRAASFNKGAGPTFYPGDEYVDWIGGSAVPIHSWRDFETIYGEFYSWAASRDKPVLIWAGVRENPDDPDWKATWLSDAHRRIVEEMPAVKAFVYYHALAPSGYAYWADTSPKAFDAIKRIAFDPHFNGGSTTDDVLVACPFGDVGGHGFHDVLPSSTHAYGVACVAGHGIAAGKTKTTYHPNETVRRDQMATFIAKLLEVAGVEVPWDAEPAFRDVADGNPHRRAINALAELAIVRGRPDGTYDPHVSVSRAQMASYLHAAYAAYGGSRPHSERHAFHDVPLDHPHAPAINTMAEMGVVKGYTEDLYGPSLPVRRDQMASFITGLAGFMDGSD